MKTNRRVALMVGALLIMCSGSFAWMGGQMPGQSSFGTMFTNALQAVSGGALIISLDFLNQINMTTVLFAVSVIMLLAAVVGAKPFAIGSTILSTLLVLMWLFNGGVELSSLFSSLGSLGTGTIMAIGGALVGLLAVLMPKLSLPGKGA